MKIGTKHDFKLVRNILGFERERIAKRGHRS